MAKQTVPPLPLPKNWPQKVRSAAVQVIALARLALDTVRNVVGLAGVSSARPGARGRPCGAGPGGVCAQHRWGISTAREGSDIWKRENPETRMQKHRPLPVRPRLRQIQTKTAFQESAVWLSAHCYLIFAIGLDEMVPCGTEISPCRYPPIEQ